MAANDDTRLLALRARVEAQGHELVRTDGVGGPVPYYIFDPDIRQLTGPFAGCDCSSECCAQ